MRIQGFPDGWWWGRVAKGMEGVGGENDGGVWVAWCIIMVVGWGGLL